MRIKLALLSLALLSAKEICSDEALGQTIPPVEASVAAAPKEVFKKKKGKECTENPLRPSQLVGRHWEGRGIGYTKGYSTIALFLTPNIDTFIPFADIRGHVYNDGKFAANVGAGARWMFPDSCIAVGGNVFYDWRETTHQSYNQVGAGLEAIGSIWDLHVNGYLPLGRKTKHFISSDKTTSSGGDFSFDSFTGHDLMISVTEEIERRTLKRKSEFVMKGFEGGIGVQAVTLENFSVRLAAGPYFFWGEFGKRAFGGKGEINIKWADCFSIGLWGSWDTLFNARTPWFLSLNIPFGPKKPKKGGCQTNMCKSPSSLNPMLFQGVDRFEMIIAHNKRLETEEIVNITSAIGPTAAIDPSTGLPYVFDFLNSGAPGAFESPLSASDGTGAFESPLFAGDGIGTFENPFSSLPSAQAGSLPGDIIFVYPPDVANGLDTGITMKNDQSLLGTGFSYTFPVQASVNGPVGQVTVPALSTPGTRTILTNSTPGIANNVIIQLANNNTISGFTITNVTGSSFPLVFGQTITKSTFTNNLVNLNSDLPGIGIIPSTTPSTFTVSGNLFNITDTSTSNTGVAIVEISNGTSEIIIDDNLFTAGMSSARFGSAISMQSQSSGSVRSTISNNKFFQYSLAIDFSNNSTGSMTGQINANTFTAPSSSATAINATESNTANIQPICLNIFNNTSAAVSGSTDFLLTNNTSNPGSFIINQKTAAGLETVNAFPNGGTFSPSSSNFTQGSCP